MKTAMQKVFGTSPRVKVLDILLCGRDFDYTLTDIAEDAKISRSTLHIMWKDLLKKNIVVGTRVIGRIQLYKLNSDSIQVKELIRMYDSLLLSESDKIKKKVFVKS